MSMCTPAVEEKIAYSADLHEHLVGKGGKTHRFLESNSRFEHFKLTNYFQDLPTFQPSTQKDN